MRINLKIIILLSAYLLNFVHDVSPHEHKCKDNLSDVFKELYLHVFNVKSHHHINSTDDGQCSGNAKDDRHPFFPHFHFSTYKDYLKAANLKIFSDPALISANFVKSEFKLFPQKLKVLISFNAISLNFFFCLNSNSLRAPPL